MASKDYERIRNMGFSRCRKGLEFHPPADMKTIEDVEGAKGAEYCDMPWTGTPYPYTKIAKHISEQEKRPITRQRVEQIEKFALIPRLKLGLVQIPEIRDLLIDMGYREQVEEILQYAEENNL
mgnify:FL=1|tara:strand:+ start:214 stop:582 length:369 start_codon:yes stop_codon:yes gene_type:complete